jgi:archaeal flagellar protein FlaI
MKVNSNKMANSKNTIDKSSDKKTNSKNTNDKNSSKIANSKNTNDKSSINKKDTKVTNSTSKNHVVKSYYITEGGFNMSVKITGGAGMSFKYNLEAHELSPATAALLDQVKQELIRTVHLSTQDIMDPKSVQNVKKIFTNNAAELIETKLPRLDKEVKNFLVMNLVKDMLGLGDIDILLNDPNLEEIVITSSNEPLRVFHKEFGWLATNVFIPQESEIRDKLNTIARRVGRQITTLNPLLDAHLITGDRANAVLYPISSKGNILTIRKFSRDPWTVTDLIKNKTCTSKVFALIWFAIQYESNVLISGGTGSGKTSFLNVCMPFMPPNHRIVSIEDTRELMLPEFLFWTPLTVRQPNPEGKGEVTMLQLMINSLRMRPDRIVLGEMRKKDQAEVLFEAMHTGHSVYATVHADSVISTIQRLSNPPIEVPANLLSAVNLNVVMFRNRRLNVRRVYQIGEYLPTEDDGQSKVKPHLVYRWKASTDELIEHNKAIRLFEELSRHTGLSENEINADILQKQKILDWMVKKDIRSVQSVGAIMHLYYLDPKKVITVVNKGGNFNEI